MAETLLSGRSSISSEAGRRETCKLRHKDKSLWILQGRFEAREAVTQSPGIVWLQFLCDVSERSRPVVCVSHGETSGCKIPPEVRRRRGSVVTKDGHETPRFVGNSCECIKKEGQDGFPPDHVSHTDEVRIPRWCASRYWVVHNRLQQS